MGWIKKNLVSRVKKDRMDVHLSPGGYGFSIKESGPYAESEVFVMVTCGQCGGSYFGVTLVALDGTIYSSTPRRIAGYAHQPLAAEIMKDIKKLYPLWNFGFGEETILRGLKLL